MSRQCRDVPYEDAVAREIDLIALAKIIEDGRDGLPAGSGKIGNVLLGQCMLEQRLKTDLATAGLGILQDKINDSS